MDVETIAVIGGGVMGAGIAHAAVLGRFRVILIDVRQEAVDRALQMIKKGMAESVERDILGFEEARELLSRLSGGLKLEDAGEADLVIEAVPEDIGCKIGVFARLNEICRPETIFATNTSALSISELAAAGGRPDRFIGMHFFNPVVKMSLVEIVRGSETSRQTYETARRVAGRMGKETVMVNESPGFVTSRINVLIGNEAFHLLAEGVASARDIDRAIRLGLNHPMGPFEMADLVGLDTRLSILRYLHEKLGERFRPNPLLEQYVREGRLGRKVGRGVYDYGNEGK